MQKKISIFVDESGDFGKYDKRCPYYIISMVFHDQSFDEKTYFQTLDDKLNYMNLSGHVLHTGPLIRKENVYEGMDISERKKILMAFYSLYNKLDITYHSFIVPKKAKTSTFELIKTLSTQIKDFISNNSKLFDDKKIVVYYDNGQKQVNNILASVFSEYNCDFKFIRPQKYRLFQMADLVTTIEMINYKRELSINSPSEIAFFGSVQIFKKDYYKKIIKKRI